MKELSTEDQQKIEKFARSLPYAIKYVFIPSQDLFDIYYDNIHADEYSLKSILRGQPIKRIRVYSKGVT